MLRAVIFDFNGIIVDDEPIHFHLFQKVLADEGITLTEETYYARYLGMDDRDCFTTACRERGKELSESDLDKLIERKAAYYQDTIKKKMKLFPGVKSLVPRLSREFPLAIASGALRKEIELILSAVSLRNHFRAIVSTEDVKHGKPEPEIFVKALSELNALADKGPLISTGECLVIEDSKEGIQGARRAGMKCLAVTNSHPAEQLKEAHAVVTTLEEVSVSFLQRMFPE